MKTLLFLACVNAPAAVLAQQSIDSLTTENSNQGYIGSFSLKYREGYCLAHSASLYRTLRDAQLGHAAHRLRAGAQVYAVGGTDPATRAYWLKVARTTYLKDEVAKCQCDTSVYYLKTSAVKSKYGLVKSFFLH
jgi:16S rRNA G1207 methylase RsmC